MKYLIIVEDNQRSKHQYQKETFMNFQAARKILYKKIKNQLELDEAWAEDNKEYITNVLSNIKSCNNFEDLKKLEDILDDDNIIFNFDPDIFEFNDLDNLFVIKLIKL